jgi:hypothetical protein
MGVAWWAAEARSVEVVLVEARPAREGMEAGSEAVELSP